MITRAMQLQTTAEEQIDELVGLMSRADEAALRRPCPGREKLGDGSVGASARHTADNYARIAAFVQASDQMSNSDGQHQNPYTADMDLDVVVRQLSISRDTLGRIAELTDGQLDAIPPKDSFRFCDGQRTFEQVIAGLLKHQRHQLDALSTAIG
jgi:hypothetical protein